MKLESLTLGKFKEQSLEKGQQRLILGARNVVTEGGSTVGEHSNMGTTHYNYGYDVIRKDRVTYHDRTLVHQAGEACDYI